MSEFYREIKKPSRYLVRYYTSYYAYHLMSASCKLGENANLIIVLLLHCRAEIGLVWSVLLGPM